MAQDCYRDSDVSTVLLAINGITYGSPLSYETMVFGGPIDGKQWRYRTKREAMAGHDAVLMFIADKYRHQGLESERIVPTEVFGDYLDDKGRHSDAEFWRNYDSSASVAIDM